MKLGALYDFVVKEGMSADWRTRQQITKKLQDTKRAYAKLSALEKKLFDKESLRNPFADTRILWGDRNREITSILVGIDMEVGELLLADRLRERTGAVDLVLSHHPEGLALAGLSDVMGLQTDILAQFGVTRSVAEAAMTKRIGEVARRLHANNHTRSVDVARLLDIPFMCCHTPADNHVAQYLQKKLNSKKKQTLQGVVTMLLKEPEYQDAYRTKSGPTILVGKPTDDAGKIMVDMTGGTEGSKEIFARISQAGVKTLVCMHLSEAHFDKIKSEHINVIIAGHIASDNIGVNLVLDKLTRLGRFDVIECSGFRRVVRTKR